MQRRLIAENSASGQPRGGVAAQFFPVRKKVIYRDVFQIFLGQRTGRPLRHRVIPSYTRGDKVVMSVVKTYNKQVKSVYMAAPSQVHDKSCHMYFET